jgi:hypothetical protein
MHTMASNLPCERQGEFFEGGAHPIHRLAAAASVAQTFDGCIRVTGGLGVIDIAPGFERDADRLTQDARVDHARFQAEGPQAVAQVGNL